MREEEFLADWEREEAGEPAEDDLALASGEAMDPMARSDITNDLAGRAGSGSSAAAKKSEPASGPRAALSTDFDDSEPLMPAVSAPGGDRVPLYANGLLHPHGHGHARKVGAACDQHAERCDFKSGNPNQRLTAEDNHARIEVTLKPSKVNAFAAALGDCTQLIQEQSYDVAPIGYDLVKIILDVEYRP